MNVELLERIKLALSDAVVMYAPEFCDESTIAATRSRTQEKGTLAYFGDLIGELHKLQKDSTTDVPVEDCPDMGYGCTNDGCIPHQIGEDEWEAQQCQFCYDVPWSRFNINKIIEAYNDQPPHKKFDFSDVKTGRLDSTKPNESNIPKSKEEE